MPPQVSKNVNRIKIWPTHLIILAALDAVANPLGVDADEGGASDAGHLLVVVLVEEFAEDRVEVALVLPHETLRQVGREGLQTVGEVGQARREVEKALGFGVG